MYFKLLKNDLTLAAITYLGITYYLLTSYQLDFEM